MLTGTLNKPNECPRCGQFSANQDICEYCGSLLNVAEAPRHDTPQPDASASASQTPPPEQQYGYAEPAPQSSVRHHYGIHDGLKISNVPDPPQKKPNYLVILLALGAMGGCWYYFYHKDDVAAEPEAALESSSVVETPLPEAPELRVQRTTARPPADSSTKRSQKASAKSTAAPTEKSSGGVMSWLGNIPATDSKKASDSTPVSAKATPLIVVTPKPRSKNGSINIGEEAFR